MEMFHVLIVVEVTQLHITSKIQQIESKNGWILFFVNYISKSY